MALVKCTNCGHMISDRAAKCPKCGAPVQKEKAAPQREVKIPEPSIAEYEEYDDGSRKKRTMYAVCGILAVLLIIGGVVFFNKKDNSSQSNKNTTELIGQSEQGLAEPEENIGADETETPSDIYSGLSFRTFTEHGYDSDNNAHYQTRLEEKQVVRNLQEHGFTLTDTKTESRLDYTGEEYYDATIKTYSKTINGQTTTVKLEENYTEIRFPSRSDVDKFIATVKAADMTEATDGFKDNKEVYWAGTDVYVNGTTVKLDYKGEP